MKELKDMSLEELWQLFPIILKEHNPDYENWYIEEKERISCILHNCPNRINHIGSTSVEGLIAKPIIDILLELPISYDLDCATDILKKSGWIVMARNDAEHMLDLNRGYTLKGFAEKVYHLHVKPYGDWGELYFRDYLRQHSDVAQKYGELKKCLKEQFEHNRDAYTNAKTNFIITYTQQAREEFAGRYLPTK